MSNKKYIIFDKDSTLIDSFPAVVSETARSQGMGIIILTNKRQELAEQVCTRLLGKSKIGVIIGRLDATPIKPREILRKRLLSHGITTDQHIKYYGDSETGRQTAQLLNVEYINTKKVLV